MAPTKGSPASELEAEASPIRVRKANRKRAASNSDLSTGRETIDAGNAEATQNLDDPNEPTMGEKLASLNLIDNDRTNDHTRQESSPQAKPPSADSVHVLLKQALRADDRSLLLDCLYNQDEKVITNSLSLLIPADVLKLLHSLISIIQSRGAVLVCALPWLRHLLLQHATGIISQESSLAALNSLYQLIESRVSTLHSSFQLLGCLDLIHKGVSDEIEEKDTIVPVIYEERDTSDEEGSADSMDAEQDNEEDIEDEVCDAASDVEGSDDMSD